MVMQVKHMKPGSTVTKSMIKLSTRKPGESLKNPIDKEKVQMKR